MTTMHRLLLLMGMFGWVGALPAQDRTVVEPDGTRIATHQVSLLTELPAPCISLEAEGGAATLVIPRNEVNRLAARDEKAVEDGISRMDFLASGRARDLLKLMSDQRDDRGCQRIRGKLPLDTTYLIGWLLEHGRVAVFTHRFHLPEPAIIVRRTDGQLSGYESFLLLDGTMIWSYGTWVV